MEEDSALINKFVFVLLMLLFAPPLIRRGFLFAQITEKICISVKTQRLPFRKEKNIMSQKSNKTTFKLATMAMLAALSVVSIFLIHIRLIPAASFLEYDAADIFVMIAGLIFGPVEGLAVLFVASLIQALTVSIDSGIYGFIMHVISSGVFMLVPVLVYRKFGKSTKSLIVGVILGTVSLVLVMIPLNIIITGNYFTPMGSQAIIDMLLPIFVPFNLLKGILNSIFSVLVFLPLKSILKSLNFGEF